MKYTTLNAEDMAQNELTSICAEIQTALNCGLTELTVEMTIGVNRTLTDLRGFLEYYTGGLNSTYAEDGEIISNGIRYSSFDSWFKDYFVNTFQRNINNKNIFKLETNDKNCKEKIKNNLPNSKVEVIYIYNPRVKQPHSYIIVLHWKKLEEVSKLLSLFWNNKLSYGFVSEEQIIAYKKMGSTYAEGGEIKPKDIKKGTRVFWKDTAGETHYSDRVWIIQDYNGDLEEMVKEYDIEELDDLEIMLKSEDGMSEAGVYHWELVYEDDSKGGSTYAKGGEITIEGNPNKNQDFFIYVDGNEVVSWNVDEMEEDEFSEETAKEMYRLFKEDKEELRNRLSKIMSKGGSTYAGGGE
jgi:hypothetical protein